MSERDRDDVLDVARALPAPAPSTAQHRRRRRLLDDAIAADQHARRRPRLSRLGIAVAAGVFFAVAAPTLAALALALDPSAPKPAVDVAAVADVDDALDVTPVAPVVPVVPAVDAAPIIDAAPVEVIAAPAPAPPRRRAAPRADDVAAAVTALRSADDRGASTTLSTTARDDFARVDVAIAAAVDGALGDTNIDDDARARLRRVRCELHLRYRRDAGALEVCRAFSRHHPDDLAVRPLAFGAGGLAEQLGRFDDAIDLYTRCIVVAPLHGQSSADALKARARVHAAAGHVDDAAADLRLFLRLRPAAGFDDDVRALARSLGVR